MNPLVPSRKTLQKAANSSSVPSRRRGTRCARPLAVLGAVAAGGVDEAGKVHEVRTDGVHLHAVSGDLTGHIGDEHVRARPHRRVQRRARGRPRAGRAGDDEHLPVPALDHRWHDGLEEVVGASRLSRTTSARSAGSSREAAGDDIAREHAGGVDDPRNARAPRPPGAAPTPPRTGPPPRPSPPPPPAARARRRCRRGVAEDEVVLGRGEHPGERRSDVSAGVRRATWRWGSMVVTARSSFGGRRSISGPRGVRPRQPTAVDAARYALLDELARSRASPAERARLHP